MRIVTISRTRIPGGSHLHVPNLVHRPMFPNAPTNLVRRFHNTPKLRIVCVLINSRVLRLPNLLSNLVPRFHNTPTLTIVRVLLNPRVQCLPNRVRRLLFHDIPTSMIVQVLLNPRVQHLCLHLYLFNNLLSASLLRKSLAPPHPLWHHQSFVKVRLTQHHARRRRHRPIQMRFSPPQRLPIRPLPHCLSLDKFTLLRRKI